MDQTTLFQVESDAGAFDAVLKAWPDGDAAKKYFAEHLVSDHVRNELRVWWKDAWFVDVGIICSPNPGKMSIGVYAKSNTHGSLRYGEFLGDGNASIAAQMAVEKASSLMMAKGMRLGVLRSNTKFLESKLLKPSDADKEMMPIATSLFHEAQTHRFIWTQDMDTTGMRIAKELASASLT